MRVQRRSLRVQLHLVHRAAKLCLTSTIMSSAVGLDVTSGLLRSAFIPGHGGTTLRAVVAAAAAVVVVVVVVTAVVK